MQAVCEYLGQGNGEIEGKVGDYQRRRTQEGDRQVDKEEEEERGRGEGEGRQEVGEDWQEEERLAQERGTPSKVGP